LYHSQAKSVVREWKRQTKTSLQQQRQKAMEARIRAEMAAIDEKLHWQGERCAFLTEIHNR
jgi:hypothetical protein